MAGEVIEVTIKIILYFSLGCFVLFPFVFRKMATHGTIRTIPKIWILLYSLSVGFAMFFMIMLIVFDFGKYFPIPESLLWRFAIFFIILGVILQTTRSFDAYNKMLIRFENSLQVPVHKGDTTCPFCLTKKCEKITIFHCGHFFTCEDCFLEVIRTDLSTCPRCRSKRIY